MNYAFFGTGKDWQAFCNISEGEEIEYRWEKGLITKADNKEIACDWVPYPNCYFEAFVRGHRYSKIFIPRCMKVSDLLFGILPQALPDNEVIFYTKDELYKEN